MVKLPTAFALCIFACIYTVNCASLQNEKSLLNSLVEVISGTAKSLETLLHANQSETNQTVLSKMTRVKRQFLDFEDFDPSIREFQFDYMDWVCDEDECLLCNILTSECCDPAEDSNCLLADSCFNNPCLAGGTCITTSTLDGFPDFTCACLPGLTGKYCQLKTIYDELLRRGSMDPPFKMAPNPFFGSGPFFPGRPFPPAPQYFPQPPQQYMPQPPPQYIPPPPQQYMPQPPPPQYAPQPEPLYQAPPPSY